MGRAAEEQPSTFYTAGAAELCMSYVRYKALKKKTGTYEYEFYSSRIYTWLQYDKPQIQAPGSTFSYFGDEVWME